MDYPRRLLFCPVLMILVSAAQAAVPARGPTTGTPVPSSAPAASLPAAPFNEESLPELIVRLADPDFATREAAQRQLDSATRVNLETLRRFATATPDPEAKARLAARVAAIEEDLLVHPPALSVDFKNASLLDVADGLSKAMGMKLDVTNIGGAGNGVYTLTAREKPFWDIFLDLSRQHGLLLQDTGSQLRLYPQESSGWRMGAVSGPIAVFPQQITRVRSATFQGENGPTVSPETLQFSYAVVLDPRVRVIKYTFPVFTAITDDLGNDLLHDKSSPPGNNLPMEATFRETGGRNLLSQSSTTILQIPEKKGTRIASAKGSVRYILLTREEVVEVADPDKKIGVPIDIGGTSITLSRLSLPAGAVGTSFINVGASLTNNNVGVDPAGAAPVTLSVVDANGRAVISMQVRGSISASASGTSFTAPYKLRLSIPTKTQDVTFPFELKDLPLP